MKQGTSINGKAFTFERIIGLYLKTVRERSCEFVGADLQNVVMGRPVHFTDNDTAADKRAEKELEAIAHSVGFKNVLFQFEPIAAAFAHEQQIAGEKLALVADLGGGTSDFSIIRLAKDYVKKQDRSSDILANTGVRIGGNDFDKEWSLKAIMPELGYRSTYGAKRLEVPLKYYHDLSEWSKVNFLYTPKVLSQIRQYLIESHDKKRLGRLLALLERERGHSVLALAEEGKIALTSEEQYHGRLDVVDDGLHVVMNRTRFEETILSLVRQITATATECVADAGIENSDIEIVILTGGSTEVPLVQQCFQEMFPSASISGENKLSSVGLGLGYDSRRRFS
jgi:hypothetical chaperone protein